MITIYDLNTSFSYQKNVSDFKKLKYDFVVTSTPLRRWIRHTKQFKLFLKTLVSIRYSNSKSVFHCQSLINYYVKSVQSIINIVPLKGSSKNILEKWACLLWFMTDPFTKSCQCKGFIYLLFREQNENTKCLWTLELRHFKIKYEIIQFGYIFCSEVVVNIEDILNDIQITIIIEMIITNYTSISIFICNTLHLQMHTYIYSKTKQ